MSYNLIAIYSSSPQQGKDTVSKIIQSIAAFPNAPDSYIAKGLSDFPRLPFEKIFLGSTEWKVKRFGDALKEMVQSHFPSEFSVEAWENGDATYRNGIMPSLNKTRREVLQGVGMKMREFDEDYWVKALFSGCKEEYFGDWGVGNHIYKLPKCIISDLRLPNEYLAIEERGGLLIKVVRSSAEKNDHESENQLEDHFFHEVIMNDSTIEELTEKVRVILNKYKII